MLESFCDIERQKIGMAMRSLLAMESVSVVDESLLLRAIEVYEGDRLDFA